MFFLPCTPTEEARTEPSAAKRSWLLQGLHTDSLNGLPTDFCKRLREGKHIYLGSLKTDRMLQGMGLDTHNEN